MSTDPRIDAYIAAAADFARPILTHLRERVHAVCPAVEESIKWGMPFFSYRGRPMMNMAAFKAHTSFGFWDRAALAGKQGGPIGQRGRYATLPDLPSEDDIDAQIRAAMALIDADDRPKRARSAAKPEAEVPPALAAALEKDATATATFTSFSPSCRRDYCEWIADAKREETRDKRIAEAIGWLREGKRRNRKYESR